MTIVRAGPLIDGTGAAPVRDVSLVLHDGRIDAITTGGGPPGARDDVIDASEMTVCAEPGRATSMHGGASG